MSKQTSMQGRLLLVCSSRPPSLYAILRPLPPPLPPPMARTLVLHAVWSPVLGQTHTVQGPRLADCRCQCLPAQAAPKSSCRMQMSRQAQSCTWWVQASGGCMLSSWAGSWAGSRAVSCDPAMEVRVEVACLSMSRKCSAPTTLVDRGVSPPGQQDTFLSTGSIKSALLTVR